jgi:hypothetical protein
MSKGEEVPLPPLTIDELSYAAAVTVNIIMRRSAELPEQQRFALVMTIIVSLVDKMLRVSDDPAFTYVALMHALSDVYRNVTGETAPDRTIQ